MAQAVNTILWDLHIDGRVSRPVGKIEAQQVFIGLMGLAHMTPVSPFIYSLTKYGPQCFQIIAESHIAAVYNGDILFFTLSSCKRFNAEAVAQYIDEKLLVVEHFIESPRIIRRTLPPQQCLEKRVFQISETPV